MIQTLKEVEKELPTLLQATELWESYDIDDALPIVERVWTYYGDYRIYLHRIHSCHIEDATLHPHARPCAMKIIEGGYHQYKGIGGDRNLEPPTTLIYNLQEKDTYHEMLDINEWHKIAPVKKYSMSVMIGGKTWDRPSRIQGKEIGPLDEEKKMQILTYFRDVYGVSCV